MPGYKLTGLITATLTRDGFGTSAAILEKVRRRTNRKVPDATVRSALSRLVKAGTIVKTHLDDYVLVRRR